jgi:hypothetical protein
MGNSNSRTERVKEELYSVTVKEDGKQKDVKFTHRQTANGKSEINLVWEPTSNLPTLKETHDYSTGTQTTDFPSPEQPPQYERLEALQPSFEEMVKIPHPTYQDILTAALRWNEIAVASKIKYAIIGGLSANILGSSRRTRTLDILIAPRVMGNQSFLQPLLNELFDLNANILSYTLTNRHGHIVVTTANAGVPVNFIDCVNNIFNFPDLIAPTQPDGRPWNQDDPEPTWSYQRAVLANDEYKFPVVLPRLLLQQRLLHFEKRNSTISTKTNDVKDIITYLDALQGSENQSFTDEEAQLLLPRIWEVLRFAERQWLSAVVDVNKWNYINIPLVEGDWRQG